MLRPERVFDGVDPRPHTGWSVLVRGNRIEAAGPDVQAPADARVIDLPGQTLMPGMIEGHSHLFLHPYNETSWDDQVLHEPLALRTARAVNHARATLMAGFTTVRDLGTEGAGYADAGLRRAINEGIVPGPRMLIATRAIVATGAYGPKGLRARRRGSAGRRGGRRRRPGPRGAQPDRGGRGPGQTLCRLPLGPGRAEPPDLLPGRTDRGGRGRPLRRAVRSPSTPVPPRGCAARSSPGPTPWSTAMRGTPEIFRLMAEHGTALCPTLAATDADHPLSRLERRRARARRTS